MTAVAKKYLSAADIEKSLGKLVFDPLFVPLSQDSYNETAIIEEIQKTGKAKELLHAAITMACVGYGQKKYGAFKVEQTQTEISELLTLVGVKTNLVRDAKLTERELTPQRLCRAFRHQIRDFLIQTHFESYLYRKYSNHNPVFADICFRGSEFLDDLSPEQVTYLMMVYNALDSEKGIDVSARIKRVFQAKGKMPRVVVDAPIH